MLVYLRKTTSLNNLFKPHPAGQIATMLMLFMVVILLFILTTVNLGQVSLKTTTLSNAADTAALLLGSRLASQSRAMVESLEFDELPRPGEVVRKRVATGILPGLIAGLVIAACLFIPGVGAFVAAYAGLAILAAMGVGAAVGAATGALTGIGAGAGALQGAIVGGSIAGGYAAAVAGPAAGGGAAGAGAGGGGAGAGAGAGISVSATGMVTVAPFALGASATSFSLAGAIVGVSFGAASSLYNQAVVQADIENRIIKSLSNIEDDYARLREEAIYSALSLVVDDPNKVPDVNDINGNGDTQELIPAFENWYYERLQDLQFLPNIDLIAEFIGKLKGFLAVQPDDRVRGILRQLQREEVECGLCDCGLCDCENYTCNEGRGIELFRSLASCRYNTDIWQPGPGRQELFYWYSPCFDCGSRGNCDTCDPCLDCIRNGDCQTCDNARRPVGLDSVDAVYNQLQSFIDAADYLIDHGTTDRDLKSLDWQYYLWLYLFYTPDVLPPLPQPCSGDPYDCRDEPPVYDKEPDAPKTDFWHTLGEVIAGDYSKNPPLLGLNQWIEYLEAIQRSLTPKCQLSYGDYTPNITEMDWQHPCGPLYNREWLNPEPERTPEEIAEIRGNFSPFYPCVWKKNNALNEGQTGAYFNNPVCHVTPGDRGGYLAQVETIEDVVNNLEQQLTNQYRTEEQLACLANCPEGSNCNCTLENFDLKITRLQLSNTGKQGACSRGGNLTDSILAYDFYYTYNCKQCCQETRQRVIDHDEEGEPIYEEYIVTVCRYLCNGESCEIEGVGSCTPENAVPCKKEFSKSKPLPGVTDIVEIPEVNGSNTQATVGEFLGRVSAVGRLAGGIGTDSWHVFVTIDADSGDELNPFKFSLMNFRNNLERIRVDIQDFYDRMKLREREARLTSGEGEKEYGWNDTQGFHKVKVEVGPFRLPKWVHRKSGTWVWGHMNTYIEPIDDIDGSRTWVKITREDPSGDEQHPWLNLKSGKTSLGRWNPFMPNAMVSITRRTDVYYSWDRVGIARKDNK